MKQRKRVSRAPAAPLAAGAGEMPLAGQNSAPAPFQLSASAPTAVQRAPAPQTGTQPATPTAEELAALKTKMQADLSAKFASLGRMQFKSNWQTLRNTITTLAGKKANLPESFQFLLEPATKDELAKLSAADRESIAAALENTLITNLTGLSGADLDTEFNALPSAIRGNIEGGRNGYVGIRKPLFETFGDLAGMKAYYADMKSADFPSASSSAKGRYTQVHKNLKDRLDKAIALMKSKKTGDKTWFEIMEANVKGVGGFNIRENRNNVDQLSDHSFGWAIDIDAPQNPNFRSVDEQMVSAVSGIDIDKGTSVENIRKGGNADALLPDIEKLKAGSKQFQTAFSDDAHFKAEFLKQLSAAGITLDDAAYAAYTTLIAQNKKSSGLHEFLKTKYLAQHFDKESKEFDTKVGPLATLLIQSYDTATAKKEKADVVQTALKAELAIVGLNPGKTEMKTLTTLLSGKAKDKNSKVEELLKKMFFTKNTAGFNPGTVASVTHKMYLTNQAVSGNHSTITAQTEATNKSVAVHGYLNLPGELIAALTGQDGGDLDWLGATGGTKDYMHFQLKSGQRPPLVKAVPATATATAPATATATAPATPVIQEKSLRPDTADRQEQEADQMAEQISTQMPFKVSADPGPVQRKQ